MALLNLTTVTASSPAPGIVIKAQLTDSRGASVTGFDTAESAYVTASVVTTDAQGEASLDLTPNADITPPSTYYTIWIGSNSFLITKSADPQSLLEALVP
jgi:hypothetical protein